MSSVPAWLEKWESQQSATVPRRIPKQELLNDLKNSPKSVAIVDLRNEQENGFITQAVHIPSTVINGPDEIQSKLIDPVLAAFPETKKIVIHCNSSGKRASFVGGWAKDHLSSYGPKNVDLEILDEGIVGWLAGDEEFKSETTLV